MPTKMMAISKNVIGLAMGAVTLAVVGAGSAAADGYPAPPQSQYQAPAPDYRAPPVQRDHGYPPPPPVAYGYPAPPPVTYYEYAEPEVVVVPRPYPYYIGRFYGPAYTGPFWGHGPAWPRGPFIARGYGWGHFHRGW